MTAVAVAEFAVTGEIGEETEELDKKKTRKKKKLASYGKAIRAFFHGRSTTDSITTPTVVQLHYFLST